MLTAKEESYNQLILDKSNEWDIVGDLSFCRLLFYVASSKAGEGEETWKMG